MEAAGTAVDLLYAGLRGVDFVNRILLRCSS